MNISLMKIGGCYATYDNFVEKVKECLEGE